ncbi:hypothetical protein ACQKOM_27040 [Peribacillus frigoritolerans]
MGVNNGCSAARWLVHRHGAVVAVFWDKGEETCFCTLTGHISFIS